MSILSDRRLRIANATVVTMDEARRVLAPGEIVVRGDSIEHVGPPGAMPALDEEIDARGMIAMPGLVNAHTHLHNALQRGQATEARTLSDWFDQVRPYASRMTGEHMTASAELACLEMIESGTTCFADSSNVDYSAPVVQRSGLRALLASTSLDEGPQVEAAIARRAAGLEVPSIIGDTDFVVRSTLRQVNEWHGGAGGRIQVAMSVHSPETASVELHRRIAQASAADGLRVLEHVAESKASAELARERHGCSPVELLERLGALTDRLLAAHCVRLSERDVELMAARGVKVAHNPVSNLRIGEVAHVSTMLRRGIVVGLGTDSSASNSDLDMFKEMHFAGGLQRTVTSPDEWLVPMKLLEMATIGSARALGLGATIGSLEVGKRADIVLVDMRETHLVPSTDPVGQLITSARGTDVDTVIVNGAVLMRGRRVLTLDKRAVLAGAQRAFDEIHTAVSRNAKLAT